MGNQVKWGAKDSVTCFIFVTIIVFTVYNIFGFGIFQQTPWHINLDPLLPHYIIIVPIVQVLILTTVLMLSKNEGAGLEDLGFKKPNPKTLARASAAMLALYIVTEVVTFSLTTIFGQDPQIVVFTEAAIPRSPLQLAVYLLVYMVLVGPVEELVFRGFIQKGLQNTYGETGGLLIASAFFGLPHYFNYPYNAATAAATGLVLGYVWQKTDENTTITAIIHGVFNSIGLIILFLSN